MVVQTLFLKEIQGASRGAGLGIGSAEHHAPDARMEHGAHAHGARLQRHVQGRAHRDLALARGAPRELQRVAHEILVIYHDSDLYSSGLKPTITLPLSSTTGRLIKDGCAAMSAWAFCGD